MSKMPDNWFNTRLKVERYDGKEGVSGNDWLIADCLKDIDLEYGYAVVTDHIHISELKLNPEMYAKMFAQFPKMYELLIELFPKLEYGDQVKVKKLIDEIRRENDYEKNEVNENQMSIYDELFANPQELINDLLKEDGFLDKYHFSEYSSTELTFVISEEINDFIIDCLNNDERDFKITLEIKE